MIRDFFLFAGIAALLSSAALAQDAKSVVDSAARAMGVENLGAVRYTGSGLNYALGQAVNPTSPWPKFNVKTYERLIDFDAGAMSQTMTRTQGENPPRGGFSPCVRVIVWLIAPLSKSIMRSYALTLNFGHGDVGLTACPKA